KATLSHQNVLTYPLKWGFFGHEQINYLAVFTLPKEILPFYKKHIAFIKANAVNPDKRRYVDTLEAPRHYIDLDVYGDSSLSKLPRYWGQAVEAFTEDTLLAYGIVPWQITKIHNYLTAAFLAGDSEQVLRLSADLGHYIADANVPLHTTENYNGQMTGQHGIHGFWESRLPELFFESYDLLTGSAKYIDRPQEEVWEAIKQSHTALDSVLLFEKQLSGRFKEEKKYSYEDRKGRTVRVYSYEFSAAYHRKLGGMVERRMRAAIKMTGDFWYTAWVNAGQPSLSQLDGIDERRSVDRETNSEESVINHESGEPVGGN
ncbi:MAG: hypothetical protein ACJASO_003016, partial [Cyclobacteriaceae bacterium]